MSKLEQNVIKNTYTLLATLLRQYLQTCMFLIKPPGSDNEYTQPQDLTCSLLLLEQTPSSQIWLFLLFHQNLTF